MAIQVSFEAVLLSTSMEYFITESIFSAQNTDILSSVKTTLPVPTLLLSSSVSSLATTSAIPTPQSSTPSPTTSAPSPTGYGTTASSSLTPVLASYTTSLKNNASSSPSSSHTPTTTSSLASSNRAVIIGYSVGAAALLCFIMAISLLLYLRSRQRNSDARCRPYPFEHLQPTDPPVNRNDKAGIWKGHVHNHALSESDVSVTMVGTGGPGSISDNVDLPSGQRTPAATSTAPMVDVLPEERSAIARCQRSRELEKLYPSQHLRATRTQTRDQEGHENRGRGADDAGVNDYEPHPKPRREHRAKSWTRGKKS